MTQSEKATACYECGGPLHGPYCPECESRPPRISGEDYAHPAAMTGEAGVVVERLRTKRMRVHDLSGVGWEDDPDCQWAADLIEAQAVEIERLREDLAAHKRFLRHCADDREAAEAKCARLVGSGQFLLDRLSELEITEELARDWFGHIEPAIARFSAALNDASHGGEDD